MKISMSDDEDLPLLEVKNLTVIERRSSFFGFFHKNTVIKDLTFTLDAKKSLGIVGDENSGKDALIAVIAGLKKATNGEICIGGRPISQDPHYRSTNVRMLFNSSSNSLNPKMRVQDLLEIPLMINTEMKEDERIERVQETLKLVDLTSDIATKYPTTLSIGQRKRVALARALILNPHILLANKTMSSFDPIMRTYICSLFEKLKKDKEISTVIATSDLDIVMRCCDYLLVMHDGKLADYGPSMDIIRNSENEITRKLVTNFENEYQYHDEGPLLQ